MFFIGKGKLGVSGCGHEFNFFTWPSLSIDCPGSSLYFQVYSPSVISEPPCFGYQECLPFVWRDRLD
jgi:hypothetical protein